MTLRKKVKNVKLFGIMLLLLIVLFNPYTVKLLIKQFTEFELFNIFFYIIIGLVDIGIISLSYNFYFKPRKTMKQVPSILLLIITIIVCIVLMEFLLMGAKSTIKPNEIKGEYTEKFHHMYKPDDEGFRYPSKMDEFEKVFIKTNSIGMIGEEIPQEKTRERILILGDSFVEAEETQEEDRVSSIMQTKLGDEYYVRQHGYSSWSPILEYNYLLKEFDEIKPDRVYLVLCINDFYDLELGGDSFYESQAVFDELGNPINFPGIEGSKSFLTNMLRLNILTPLKKSNTCEEHYSEKIIDDIYFSEEYDKEQIKEQIGSLNENLIRLSRSSESWDDETKTTVNKSFEYILKMNEFLKERNASLYIMLTPLGWNVANNEIIMGKVQYPYCLDENALYPDFGIRNEIKLFANNKNIGYVELIDEMSRYKHEDPTRLLFYRADGHWNKEAQKLVANEIMKTIPISISAS